MVRSKSVGNDLKALVRYYVRVVRRAAADTRQFARAKTLGIAAVLALLGVAFSWYWAHLRNQHLDPVGLILAAVLPPVVLAAVVFLWNLVMAPVRLDRERGRNGSGTASSGVPAANYTFNFGAGSQPSFHFPPPTTAPSGGDQEAEDGG